MSTTPFLIPLTAAPQSISITLAGVEYQINVWWNNVSQNWMLDISDINGDPIVTGIPMVTGRDLLEPYAYLGFGGQLIAQTTNDTDAVPTFVNLGDQGNLYFVLVDD
jgi:hypothetical protein